MKYLAKGKYEKVVKMWLCGDEMDPGDIKINADNLREIDLGRLKYMGKKYKSFEAVEVVYPGGTTEQYYYAGGGSRPQYCKVKGRLTYDDGTVDEEATFVLDSESPDKWKPRLF